MPETHWIRLHWFELTALFLLCLNFWFVYSVLHVLRETNRWLYLLSTMMEDKPISPG